MGVQNQLSIVTLKDVKTRWAYDNVSHRCSYRWHS
jgi:hypothetical protein